MTKTNAKCSVKKCLKSKSPRSVATPTTSRKKKKCLSTTFQTGWIFFRAAISQPSSGRKRPSKSRRSQVTFSPSRDNRRNNRPRSCSPKRTRSNSIRKIPSRLTKKTSCRRRNMMSSKGNRLFKRPGETKATGC